MRISTILALVLLISCGDDDRVAPDGSADGSADVSRSDATGSDAEPSDAGEDDAVVADAGEDAPVVDAGDDAPAVADAGDDAPAQDAGDDAPSGVCEGTLMGTACSVPEDCGDLSCSDGICMPSFGHAGGCGGFVGATCDVPDHPFCLYGTGADAGPCMNEAERACACSMFRDQYVCL